MYLVESDEAFFYVDQILSNNTYRIFNYRLASYTQWLHDGALECRGITFMLDDEGNAAALVSWPFEKFFNLHENPLSGGGDGPVLDLDNPLEVQEKMDGSLISSMYCVGESRVWMKSKGSLFSEQATAARLLLETEEYADLAKFVDDMVMLHDYTVIMEYTAPDNRIVVAYDKPGLTVLGVRDNWTGAYIPLTNTTGDVTRFFVRDIAAEVTDTEEFVKTIADMQHIEGFVIRLRSGQRVKIKGDWYAKLHHIKDSINSQRRLFEAVVYDTIDDVRAQFYDDEQAMALINEMEEKVSVIYNHMVDTVERFYERNKHLERKEFAILGKQELENIHFSLAMSKYIGREVDYRATMVKHRKTYGIKDDPTVDSADE